MKKLLKLSGSGGIYALVLVFGLLWAQRGLSQQASAISYDTYCNGRFGYCIKYPDKLLKAQTEAQNDDGCVFTDKNGKPILTVYGTSNVGLIEDNFDPSLKEVYTKELADYKKMPGITVTYSVLGKSLYVISGRDKGKIFYRKIIKKEDGFGYALLEYDSTERAVYDTVSGVVFKSFK